MPHDAPAQHHPPQPHENRQVGEQDRLEYGAEVVPGMLLVADEKMDQRIADQAAVEDHGHQRQQRDLQSEQQVEPEQYRHRKERRENHEEHLRRAAVVDEKERHKEHGAPHADEKLLQEDGDKVAEVGHLPHHIDTDPPACIRKRRDAAHRLLQRFGRCGDRQGEHHISLPIVGAEERHARSEHLAGKDKLGIGRLRFQGGERLRREGRKGAVDVAQHGRPRLRRHPFAQPRQLPSPLQHTEILSAAFKDDDKGECRQMTLLEADDLPVGRRSASHQVDRVQVDPRLPLRNREKQKEGTGEEQQPAQRVQAGVPHAPLRCEERPLPPVEPQCHVEKEYREPQQHRRAESVDQSEIGEVEEGGAQGRRHNGDRYPEEELPPRNLPRMHVVEEGKGVDDQENGGQQRRRVHPESPRHDDRFEQEEEEARLQKDRHPVAPRGGQQQDRKEGRDDGEKEQAQLVEKGLQQRLSDHRRPPPFVPAGCVEQAVLLFPVKEQQIERLLPLQREVVPDKPLFLPSQQCAFVAIDEEVLRIGIKAAREGALRLNMLREETAPVRRRHFDACRQQHIGRDDKKQQRKGVEPSQNRIPSVMIPLLFRERLREISSCSCSSKGSYFSRSSGRTAISLCPP